MNYLLDVNVLVAWGWEDHEHHELASRWIKVLKTSKADTKLFTCPITELGFVRVSMYRSSGQVTCHQAGRVLKTMLESLENKHGFLRDEITSYEWPKWCKGASQTTDAHLLQLAENHGAVFATLDKKIPRAYVIDGLQD